MVELIAMIFEYRLLRAKTDRLSITLGDTESCRLAALERMLSGEEDPHRDPRRAMARARVRAFVRFTLPGDIGIGELHDISAGGARIDTSHPPAPGTPVLLAVQLAPAHEFVFPGRVVWRETRGVGSFGVAFDGVPTRRSLAHPVQGINRLTPPQGLRPSELPVLDPDDDERASITEIKCKTPVPEAPAAGQLRRS